jgi:hypothetical protein
MCVALGSVSVNCHMAIGCIKTQISRFAIGLNHLSSSLIGKALTVCFLGKEFSEHMHIFVIYIYGE